MTRYTADLGFDTLTIECDLSDPSAPICYIADGERIPTQYQTADAFHYVHRAFALVLSVLGPDYYADPSDSRSPAEQLEEMLNAINKHTPY